MIYTKLYQRSANFLKIIAKSNFGSISLLCVEKGLCRRPMQSYMKSIRFYLSPACNCDEKWKLRLHDPFIKDIKPVEFYYELIRKYKREKKISSIDADIFINRLTEENIDDFLDETEEILRLLRRSPETINTLPSTPHAVIRLLWKSKKYDLMFKIFTDPMNYGVFLDYFTADLLMSTFMKEENYTAAARVASMLMLQEDYGPSLTKSLVLLSCLKYVFNPVENQPWIDYHPKIEPEEEVKILVRYVRNPHFDDHFDLKEPLHIVGKTLAWLSFHLEDSSLKVNSEVLGWSLYQKWNDLEKSLNALKTSGQVLDQVIFDKVNEQIATCEIDDRKTKLTLLMESIVGQKLVSEIGFIEKAEKDVISNAQKFETEIVENQVNTYDAWIEKRKEAVDEQLQLMEKNRLMQEIKEKKADLEKREDVIFFFEKKNEFDLLLQKKRESLPKTLGPEHMKKKKKKSETADEDYIPPEV